MSKRGLSFGLASILYCSGCIGGKAQIPSRVEGYELTPDAIDVLSTQTNIAMRKFQRVIRYSLDRVDDGDSKISEAEAYKAVNLILPEMDRFFAAFVEEENKEKLVKRE